MDRLIDRRCDKELIRPFGYRLILLSKSVRSPPLPSMYRIVHTDGIESVSHW